MPQLSITQLGNPVLRQKAAEVSQKKLATPQVKNLIKDMKQTLLAEDGLGLAAPQVSQLVRIIAVHIPPELMGHKVAGVALQALINPKIIQTDDEKIEDWEGCLSFNFLRGRVPRYRRIIVEAWDESGDSLTIEAYDLYARVLQHEIDHLDGILYLDRMKDMKSLMSLEEFEKMFKERNPLE
ncbi:peptide deformylase [candidate division CPR3 bacterium 4484_211]|uniref:Peptide deformylase n=1 Tax=candidate division CPR3 bacterium 4484_211 TaxID=1968527 RepID=A0A1W9NXV5_UNCC3|nr:MAG: peptide deformylase [candidate division CPR3 bacterium 4484_211]